MKKLTKTAIFTDIHWGKKSNSELHNQDCTRYVDWFCEQVRSDPTIDHVAFLGDWNENRSALNISTLNYAYRGAKKINELGLPVYFVVGNHDLYHRNTREIHSIVPFNEFSNFKIIDQVIIEPNIGDGVLFAPYLFHEEYPDLMKHITLPHWMGHFEFKGFEVTGYGMKMPTGPDPLDFKGPDIWSGHFHKRQNEDNIHYVGNCFPMDFGDAGDHKRGMAVIDHISNSVKFIDWPDCPRYTKAKLSTLLDEKIILHPNARVKCLVDIPITFEESNQLRQTFTDASQLREFVMEETPEIKEALVSTEVTADTDKYDISKIGSVNELVVQMLGDIESDHINNQKLIDIYRSL
jgi:DNA repair exonuclease SbcCD nuclease subunit